MLIRTLVIVGGASAYVPGLLQALLRRRESLSLEEVRLHDIDGPHLEIVERIGEAMAEATPGGFRVRADTDLGALLTEADVVLNSARPGGFPCRRLDETLPLEFGLPGQETVGPGGFLFALRSIPQALALARALERRAPRALLLNYTNPSNIVTQALLDQTSVPAIGLCDQSDTDLHDLGSATGKGGRGWTFRCAGLNHATWYSEVRFGDERFQLPAERPDPPSELDAEHQLRFRLSWEMARRQRGWWPNSYLPYYERPEAFVELSRRMGPRTDAIVPGLESYYRHFEEESRKERPDLRWHRGNTDFGDMAARLMEALGDVERRPIALNLRNGDMTEGLDADTVVESVVEVDAAGAHPVPAPSLPEGERALITQLERYQRAAAGAVAEGRREDLAAALAENPLVPDLATARSLLRRAAESYGPEWSLP
jgi:6-phospho-beta-glucosidase